MVSYDVEALFTSVPIKPAIAIIQRKLDEDKDLHLRTTMSSKQITSFLEFCLNSTYFTFQGKFYEQVDGTAMGSPISPIVANLFMEDLETKALATSPHPPSLWKRFVDDTFTIIKKSHKNALLEHINSIDNNIKFTCEESRDDGSIPFLDILIIPEEDGRLNTTVYRKPYPYRLIFTMGQPSQYSIKIQCNRYLISQGQNHMLFTSTSTKRRTTSDFSLEEMQVSNLGPEQSQTQEPKRNF